MTHIELRAVEPDEFVRVYTAGPHYEDVAEHFGTTVQWVRGRKASVLKNDGIKLPDLPRKGRRKLATTEQLDKMKSYIAEYEKKNGGGEEKTETKKKEGTKK